MNGVVCELSNARVMEVMIGEIRRSVAPDAVPRFARAIDAEEKLEPIERATIESTGQLEAVRRFEDLPLAAVLHTDINRDGTGVGPNLEGTVELARATAHPIIASGGIGSIADLVALARTRVIAAAVIGKALYTGRVKLRDALRELSRC